MTMLDGVPPAPKPGRRPALRAFVGVGASAVAVLLVVGGWYLWHRETHKVSQATAKQEVAQALDAMVHSVSANHPDYNSKIVLEHCDNGMGGYNGWQVYSIGTFDHQNRDNAIAMANTLSAFLRRAGYSGVKTTVDAQTVRVDAAKSDIQATLYLDSSSAGDSIDITASTGCNIVPDPTDTTTEGKIIG